LFCYLDFNWKNTQCSMDFSCIAQAKPRSVYTSTIWFASTYPSSVWPPSRNVHSFNTSTTETPVSFLRHSVCMLEIAASLSPGQATLKINELWNVFHVQEGIWFLQFCLLLYNILCKIIRCQREVPYLPESKMRFFPTLQCKS